MPKRTRESLSWDTIEVHYVYSTAKIKRGSPFQVTWSVGPKVAKVDVESVGDWCEGNIFEEDHAHGVRNLVTDPELLSEIK